MDLREQAARLRKALEAAVPPRGRRHFPDDLMREAAAYYAARAAAGLGADRVGAEIGIAGNTLRRWQRLFGAPASAPAARAVRPPRPVPAPPALVPVAVVGVAPATPATVVVRGPHGLQIEGLDVEALAVLLRRLA